MSVKPYSSFGPVFVPRPISPHLDGPDWGDSDLRCLGLSMQWSTPATACVQAIDLFHYCPDNGVHLPFNEILFHESQLPGGLRCSEFMVVKTPHGEFLPLDALLADLYTSAHFRRPALEVLRELGQRAELTFPTPAIYEKGMLVPKAEAEGFRRAQLRYF
jgi:hypothetical protein